MMEHVRNFWGGGTQDIRINPNQASPLPSLCKVISCKTDGKEISIARRAKQWMAGLRISVL